MGEVPRVGELPVLVAGDLGQVAIVRERRHVGRPHGAHGQPLGRERKKGARCHDVHSTRSTWSDRTRYVRPVLTQSRAVWQMPPSPNVRSQVDWWGDRSCRPRRDLPGRVRLRAGGRSAGGDREAGRGHRARRPLPDAPRHHRLGQVGDHRVDDPAGAASDADPRPEQEPRRPARAGDARVLPEQPGRVLRQLLRLLPARGLHPVERHLHREGLVDQRRDRSAAPLRDRRAAHATAMSSSSRRSVASTAWETPRSTRANCSTSTSASTTTCERSCVGSSTCSTTATT